jgi:CDP-diacylglycerol--serine O-phosphatidyltransferase
VVHSEERLGRAIRLHPNVLSSVKLVAITPLMFISLRQMDVLRLGPTIVLALFAGFAALDYLDGVVARVRGLESQFGRVFDRLTDYPLLITVSYFCIDVVPPAALFAKLGLDALLMLLYVLGRGSTENRLRTGISYTTLLALLLVSQGWLPRLVTVDVVEALLWANVAFSTTVALNNLGVLQKRFIADALSGANLLCGVFSMVFAARGRFEISLLFLLLGAAFDGFDGAAARKWGGTRFGVYSDDIADGVNYGIAPGVAIYFALDAPAGLAIGIAYSLFTISRLVFFTLNKSQSDPEVFLGVPSTVGGLIVLCALILFPEQDALVGVMVGVACTQMVSFSTHYRHLGRQVGKAFRDRKPALLGAPLYLLLMLLGARWWGVQVPVAVILVAILVYGFAPTMMAFRDVLRRRGEQERPEASAGGPDEAPSAARSKVETDE